MTAAVMTSRGEQARWQRQAAAELDRILDAYPELPPITWTVGPAGCVLAGQVNGLAPASQVRATFGAWQAALALEQNREQPRGSGMVFLHAAARRGGVKVRITAAVFDAGQDDDVAVTW